MPFPLTSEDEPLMPLEALRALGAAVSRELRNPLLGLHMAQELEPADYGALGFLGRAASTVRGALELFAAHADALNSAWRVTLEPSRAGACLRQRIPHEPQGLGPVGNTYFVCGLVTLARRLRAERVSPIRAWVAHARERRPEVEAFLGCPLELGREENGLEVASEVLALPLATANRALAGWLERSVLARKDASADPLAEVRRLIRESLPETPSLAAAARTLGQSPRSLQRHLADERTTYHRELDRVRSEVARELLAEGLATKEVAFRCGFADARGFSRAFKRWSDAAPRRTTERRR